MYTVPQVTDSVYYVGVNDRSKALFENMWSLPHGVSYNSYLVVDEVTTLIDTVDVCYSDVFFHKLELVLGDRPLDYLIVNHMEPDHGGSIGLLRKRYPDVKIIGNKKTFDMLKGYHGITDGLIEVKSGDAIRVGKHEFSFLLAPMVHWPEVMFTYEQTQKILFSADAFGTFGALNGHIFDHSADLDLYLGEMSRYYSCIVGKYGNFVQKAFANIKQQGLEVDYVCPTHGVVWTPAHFDKAYEIYDRLSRYEGEEGVVVLYGSMYGNTEQLADVVAQSLAAAGVKKVVCYNVSHSDPSVILRDIFRYKGLIIGSPTYCGGIFTPLETIMNLVRIREVKGRLYSIFGSYTWAPASVKKLAPFAEEMNWELVGTPFELKMADLPAVMEQAWAIGQEMAAKVLAKDIS
ncbi:FprA family A-type flavoprotein [Porphyromonas sp. COT-239 OH1446]|uniref:FprA family A-type flavoprotein n=1 Tax=Porphyromonas sp. COT-239 OH1446 TaxID=1515613 RepID=UPI00052D27E9|nr:FprA family A-type flavoprotein [Porphyromonas sp. COT-239 OH1446]KGN67182.1 flavodoxin [Porphyromonas sp. COT-239 OH1446]